MTPGRTQILIGSQHLLRNCLPVVAFANASRNAIGGEGGIRYAKTAEMPIYKGL